MEHRSSSCTMETEDEVSQLLHSWGLSDLKAKFKANYIVMQALEYLTEDDIVELIPKIGQRAIFRGRLTQWRQQNGIATTPPLKICKIEPGSEAKPEEQNNVTNNSAATQSPPRLPSPIQARAMPAVIKLIRGPQVPARQDPVRLSPVRAEPVRLESVRLKRVTQEPVRKVPVRQVPSRQVPVKSRSPSQERSKLTPAKPSLPQFKHKTYGTLIRCGPKPKKSADNTSTSTMQSKVQQFYISPPVVDTSSPSPTPTLTSSPVTPPQRTVIPKADLTPFVTSIIRVETNCDKTYAKTSPSAAETKVNRTTILQKLTNSERTSSPFSNRDNLMKDTTTEQREEEQEEEDLPEPLYPIVKLETELAEWNGCSEPEQIPDPEAESDETTNKDDDDLMVDSSDFQTECIETLDSDSAIEFDSENDNNSLLMERMEPKVVRRRKKKKKKILGKLDIRNILMNSEMGRHVLNYYEANERLDLGRRRMLIEAIVQDCWITNRRISPTDCSIIAEEIIEILPNERVEDYYLAQPGKNPKSPLYNKYRNMHNRFFIEKGLPIPVRRKKRKSQLRRSQDVDDIEVDDDLIIS